MYYTPELPFNRYKRSNDQISKYYKLLRYLYDSMFQSCITSQRYWRSLIFINLNTTKRSQKCKCIFAPFRNDNFWNPGDLLQVILTTSDTCSSFSLLIKSLLFFLRIHQILSVFIIKHSWSPNKVPLYSFIGCFAWTFDFVLDVLTN